MLDRRIVIEAGDGFLIDSKKTGPKIVKFFMTAPTWVHHLWRKIKGTQETVLYYHAGMFVSPTEIVEQQSKVITKSSEKVLNTSDRLFIFRYKTLPKGVQRKDFVRYALMDTGEGYDVVNCFGKFLTWLTGIKLFARYMEIPNQEICINRLAYWYRKVACETFGVRKHSEITTHMMYKYIKAHPELFEIVREGEPNAY